MKKLLTSISLILLTLAACAPQKPTEQSLIPVEGPIATPTHIRVDLTPAQRAAITALSGTLNLSADKIKLVSTEAVTWPNGCMGVQRMGVMCTQNKVPGFKIILEAGGRQYEFHTNQDGSAITPVEGMQVSGPAEEAVIKQLAANLGLKQSDISVVSDAEVEFGDACMGVAMEEVMCAQVVTPGRIIVLEANGIQYEYHTNGDASRVQPATLALKWSRGGGIAGFCDSMTVFLSGEVYGNQCKLKPEGTMGTFANLLSATEQKQLTAWLAQFGQVSLDASDPANVSDRMTRTLVLLGSGSAQPVKADEEALFKWAQDLFQKLYR